MILRNQLAELGLALRQKLIGRLSLRFSPPRIHLSSELNSRENRYYQTLLRQGFCALDDPLATRVIDIGCRNWSYAQALADFFPNAGLTGIEVDGNRRYWNLYRRKDVSKAHAKHIERTQNRVIHRLNLDYRDYLPENDPSLETAGIWNERDTLIFCFFFPYLSPHPCIRGGLPTRFANFRDLISHTLKIAGNHGSKAVLFSTHQGEWEAEVAREIYHEFNLTYQEETLAVEQFKSYWPSPFDTKIITVTP